MSSTMAHNNFGHCGRGRGLHNAKLAAESNSKPTEVEHEESAFPVGEVSDSNTVNFWLIDSGASRHMTPNESDFTTFVKFQKTRS